MALQRELSLRCAAKIKLFDNVLCLHVSLSDLSKAARENRRLHGAYRREVKKEVKTRLEKDSDYRPDRFPQTRDYFDKDTP